MLGSGFGRGDERAELSVGARIARFNWPLALLLTATASVGFIMLFSVAGGSLDPWARAQIVRFAAGFGVMVLVALIHIRIWRKAAAPLYLFALALLVGVEFFGSLGMGAQRWIRIGGITIQPSELMKVALVVALAAFYQWLDRDKVSSPGAILAALGLALAPAILVLKQPDLGTAMLLVAGAFVVMFLAGVSLWFFVALAAMGGGMIWFVLASRGTEWQVLKAYQYRRIETFLDPSSDPLGAGYHITQSTIAIGSGGLEGKGFMQGSQTHLSFLPEPHTDFIFTTLAEEFGFRGGVGLLALYMAIILIAMIAASRIRSTFGRLVAGGVTATFFFFFAINIAMVTGLAPVVGVPLPLVSFGGTSMLTLLFGFGLMMSAEIHRDDEMNER